MGEHRDILLRLIRLALANSKDDSVDLRLAVPDPRALDAVEKAAWIELCFGGDDYPTTTSDDRWERWRVERLRHLLASLQMRSFDHRL